MSKSSNKINTVALLLLFMTVFLTSFIAVHAQTTSMAPAASSLPVQLGWSVIPNTSLVSKCPDIPEIHGVEGCRAIIDDWGSALADTKRNRLILWGGGHNGYFGNEIYALDLQALALRRLTEPASGSSLSNLQTCPEAFTDGTPNARHDYNGLQYLSKSDRYFFWGAGLAPCGNFTNVPWLWDPNSLKWSRTNSSRHPNPAQNGSIPLTSYDSVSGSIFEVETNTGDFWKYDPSSDNWSDLGHFSACGRLNLTAAINPQSRSYFCVGNGVFDRIRIDRSHKLTHLKGSGCDALREAAAPGFDFDSFQNRMVGWAGKGFVYSYDEKMDACTREDFPQDPGLQQPNGTFGRFRYFPDLGIFVLVNDSGQNAYILRLALPPVRRP